MARGLPARSLPAKAPHFPFLALFLRGGSTLKECECSPPPPGGRQTHGPAFMSAVSLRALCHIQRDVTLMLRWPRPPFPSAPVSLCPLLSEPFRPTSTATRSPCVFPAPPSHRPFLQGAPFPGPPWLSSRLTCSPPGSFPEHQASCLALQYWDVRGMWQVRCAA